MLEVEYTGGALSTTIARAKQRMDYMSMAIVDAAQLMKKDISNIYERQHLHEIEKLSVHDDVIINVSLECKIVSINGDDESIDVEMYVPGSHELCMFRDVPIECVEMK